MSKFLGPIHTWVYNKVVFLEGLNQKLVEFAKNSNIDLDTKDLTFDYTDTLENVVDESNIHGSLQEMINQVEFKLKDIVTSLLKEIDLSEINKVAYKYGSENQISATTSEEAFKSLDDLLVSGMPCDRLNVISEKTDDKLIYNERIQLFDQYWLDSNVEYFYAIRTALVKGILKNSNFKYEQDTNNFIIERV